MPGVTIRPCQVTSNGCPRPSPRPRPARARRPPVPMNPSRTLAPTVTTANRPVGQVGALGSVRGVRRGCCGRVYPRPRPVRGLARPGLKGCGYHAPEGSRPASDHHRASGRTRTRHPPRVRESLVQDHSRRPGEHPMTTPLPLRNAPSARAGQVRRRDLGELRCHAPGLLHDHQYGVANQVPCLAGPRA